MIRRRGCPLLSWLLALIAIVIAILPCTYQSAKVVLGLATFLLGVAIDAGISTRMKPEGSLFGTIRGQTREGFAKALPLYVAGGLCFISGAFFCA